MKRFTPGNGQEYLLTAGEDKKVVLWNLEGGLPTSPESFKGHSTAIDFCTLVSNGADVNESKLLSIVFGKTPEVLTTNLAKFVSDEEKLTLGKPSTVLSPDNLFVSQDRNYAIVGQDNAHVTRTSLTAENKGTKKTIEWDVSAWKRHALSDDYLFAQSEKDYFLRFDRKTGALTGVLKDLIEENPGLKIERFQVSDDGNVALIEAQPSDETAPDLLEYQIWDLANQELIKTINYSAVVNKRLPLVKLSPDGKYVVAGKIAFAVWSTQRGLGAPIYDGFRIRSNTFPSRPISNIVFYPNDAGEPEFAVSWPEGKGATEIDSASSTPSGRIHVYTKRGSTIDQIGRFRVEITGGAFDPDLRTPVPNTFDARMIDGSRYILARASKSIDLLKLIPGKADPTFEGNDWNASEKVETF